MTTTQALVSEASPNLRKFLVSLEDFEIGKCIGEGAYGKVYLGVHKATGIQCGMKLLFAEKLEERDRTEFQRETAVMAKVSDMFVLPFLGWTATHPYAVITQYASGGSLFASLRKKPGSIPMTPTLKTINMIGIARGMMAIHKKNIMHRDLKSLNILLDERGYPKICDFGLSVDDSEMRLKTVEIGTPHWMAPELFSSSDYTNKIDVYAYGILLWEILTGSAPYKGLNAMQIALNVCNNQLRPSIPKDTPKPLASLIKACWNQDPEKRPSFKQIVSHLNKRETYFEGTDMDQLNAFFDEIEQDQKARKQGIGIGVQALGNPEFIANMCREADNNAPKENSETPQTPEKQEEQENQPDPGNPAELGNPNYPEYEKNFKLCAKTYTSPVSIRSFIEMLIPAITNDKDCRITNFILKELTKLALKQDYIYNALFSSKLFGCLPTNRRNASDAIFDLLYLFFSHKPQCADRDLINYFISLTEYNPHKMLKLIMFNLNKFGELANGWDFCNLLTYLAPTMISSDAGNEYIKVLVHMLSSYAQFSQQYTKICMKIFVASIQQFKPETSDVSYAAVIKFNDGTLKIAPAVLEKSLSTEGCENGALTYLLLNPKTVMISPGVVDALFSLASNNEAALALILKFLERKDTFIMFFPEYQGRWLVDGRISIQTSSQIMAGVLCRAEFRPYAAHVIQVPEWLTLLAKSKDSTAIGYTSITITKIGINKDFVGKLISADFFNSFVDSVIELDDKRLYQSTTVLIDSCSRICNIPGFEKYDNTLIDIALKEKGQDVPNIYLCAISALAMRSLYKEAQDVLKTNPKIGQLIQTYREDPRASQTINILWKNVASP